MRKSTEPNDQRYIETITNDGRYFGDYRYKILYKGLENSYSSVLRIDPGTLKAACRKNGWVCEIIIQESNGHYLARIYHQL